MPVYLWFLILLLSLALAYIERRLGRRGRIGRALWSFMPLILALPLTSIAGISLSTISGDPNITIFAVPLFFISSLFFEAHLNGVESLKAQLPFFLSCVIVGAIMEISGIQKGHWNYSGFGSLAGVILFGYVLFFYFAIKFGSAIRILVGKW
jgi:hypothetical protein